MGAKLLEPDKLRGGYYTSPAVARWLCDTAIESRTDRVLEPSCGDGVFIEAAANRLLALGAEREQVAGQLLGIEITPAEVRKSVARLQPLIGDSASRAMYCGDFFLWLREQRATPFDCVIGNPPFIRYQNFPEPSKSYAMDLMKQLGLLPNKLTNVWVPFVAGAIDLLAPKGRLAMVLPAVV